MPMLVSESQKPEDKADTTEPEQAEADEEVEKAQAVAEAEAITKAEKSRHRSGKRAKAKEPVP